MEEKTPRGRKRKCSKPNYDFKWTIPSFGELDKRTEVDSKKFYSPCKQSEWSLRLNPSNETIDDKSYLSVFVMLRTSGYVESVVAEPKLTIFNYISEERSVTHQVSTYAYKEDCGRGRVDFLLRCEALDESQGFLLDGGLLIICSLNIIDEPCMINRCKMLKSSESFLSKQQTLLKMGDYNDCVLVCADGDEVSASKFLLASQSTVFRAMFKGDTEEARTGRAVIPDFDGVVIEALVNFTVCGKLDSLKELDLAEELMMVADKYDMADLKEISEDKLCESLTEENLCARLILADRYNLKLLLKRVVDVLIKVKGIRFKKFADFDKLFVTENQPLVFKLFNMLSMRVGNGTKRPSGDARKSVAQKTNEKELCKSLSEENACELLIYADKRKMHVLKRHATAVLVSDGSPVENMSGSEKLFVTEHQNLVLEAFTLLTK